MDSEHKLQVERQEFCLHFIGESVERESGDEPIIGLSSSSRILPITEDDDEDGYGSIEEDDSEDQFFLRPRLEATRNTPMVFSDSISEVRKFIRPRTTTASSWAVPASPRSSSSSTTRRCSGNRLRRCMAFSQDSQEDSRVTKRMRLCDSRDDWDDDDDERIQQFYSSWQSSTSSLSSSISLPVAVTPPRPTMVHWDEELSNPMDLSHVLDLAIATSKAELK